MTLALESRSATTHLRLRVKKVGIRSQKSKSKKYKRIQSQRMHFLRRNRPGDCAARCKKTNDNLRNSKSFDLNGCDPQNLRLCPDAEQGGEKRCSFDSFESWNWTKSKQFCGHNFPTNKVNPFYFLLRCTAQVLFVFISDFLAH